MIPLDTLRTRLFPPSAIYKFPAPLDGYAGKKWPEGDGSSSPALVAGPPSPMRRTEYRQLLHSVPGHRVDDSGGGHFADAEVAGIREIDVSRAIDRDPLRSGEQRLRG